MAEAGQEARARAYGPVRPLFRTAWRLLKSLPLLLISPLLIAIPIVAIALSDIFGKRGGARSHRAGRPLGPALKPTLGATVVIPNWNGRDLLEKYLPSIIEALCNNPANEILVVDNGSTDDSVTFLRQHFPSVRVLALAHNLGFGGGSNAGFRAAANGIVVLLNSDMRVDRNFLQPLLDSFADDQVFAVSCQIFFSDPTKLRQETGLTQGWWENGGLRVRHRIDGAIQSAYPCF